MKNSHKRRVIIGYRYDAESSTLERLHEVRAVQDGLNIGYASEKQPRTLKNENQFSQTLRNESTFKNELDLLLKAQVQRLQQLSSYRSYQMLAQQYFSIQNENKLLKQNIDQLRKQNSKLIQRLKDVSTSKQSVSKSNSQILLNQGQKYAFSPYYSLKVELPQKINQKQIQLQQTSEQLQSSFNTSKSDVLRTQKYLQDQKKKGLQNINPAFFELFKGIDSDYLYNNLRTVQSQKSHEVESQIQLDKNFSFMPRPLKKNIQTLKYLSQDTKKVSFQQEINIIGAQSDGDFSFKQFAVNSNNLLASDCNFTSLTGLKKLPVKPARSSLQSIIFPSINQFN